tara:strand:+ start:3289 stop:4614 length:1326 start_codon:yes stop_codon:yes gene_type:complete
MEYVLDDSEVQDILNNEYNRQKYGIELIASENFVSRDVLKALGSHMTNKYSEGQIGNRYYGGNKYIDEMEILCKKRALELYKLDSREWHVNVQPYSGSPANFAVYTALLNPHDRIMGLDLPSGGHLTHGFYNGNKKISATSIYFESLSYSIDPITHLIDHEELEKRALLYRPKLIIAGGSAYSRDWKYDIFRNICDKIGAYLMVDMSHISGLVATEEANNPFLFADVVTTTTHKSLRGPRSGMIFCKYKMKNEIDFAVFPSLQGGPHNNVISAVAIALKEALDKGFKEYIKNVKLNSKTLSCKLIKLGYDILTNGTDNHLFVINLKNKGITGSKIEYIFEKVGISVNKNTIIGDKSALSPSGIRIGMCAITTRGFKNEYCDELSQIINKTIILAIEIQDLSETKSLKNFKENVDKLIEDKNEDFKEIIENIKILTYKFNIH